MSETSTRNANRRDELFSAAAELFVKKGYERTSVQDIADRVGLLKGSLYYYIDAKEDLLFELIENSHLGLLAMLDGVAMIESPLEKLMELSRAHCIFITENRVIVELFFNQFRSLTGERRKHILRERDRYEKAWRAIFIRGQEDGEIRADLDPKIATLGILGLVNSIHQWFRPSGTLSAQAIAEQYAAQIGRGIATDPTRLSTSRA